MNTEKRHWSLPVNSASVLKVEKGDAPKVPGTGQTRPPLSQLPTEKSSKRTTLRATGASPLLSASVLKDENREAALEPPCELGICDKSLI